MAQYLPQRMVYMRQQFAGMNPREVVVFNNWMLQHYREYTNFEYNVRVGNGSDPLPNMDAETARQWKSNTQKRLDVIAWQDNLPTIIEVKDRAGLSCIGQIKGYEALWIADNPTSRKPQLLVVANRADADIFAALSASNIPLNLVEADFTGLRPQGY